MSEAPRFSLGHLVATPGALDALDEAGVESRALLKRHLSGDWGDLDEFDKRQNNIGLMTDGRLMSSYKLETGNKIWIITEWDRSVTTLLLPEDY